MLKALWWLLVLVMTNESRGLVGASWSSSFTSITGEQVRGSWNVAGCQGQRVILFGLRGKKIRQHKRRAKQEPTPPLIPTPYGPIRAPSQPSVQLCDCCQGRGRVRCSVCDGRGIVRATGQRKRNMISADRLVGSQWTSVQIYRGHRHHKVIEIRGSAKSGSTWQARMVNCCGEPNEFWLPVRELRDKSIWRMGWLTLADIEQAQGGALADSRLCFRCKGGKILMCVDCDGKGQIPSYEPLHD